MSTHRVAALVPVLAGVLALAALGPAGPAGATTVREAATSSGPTASAHDDDHLLWLEVEEVGLGRLSRSRVLRWQVGAHLSGAPEGRLTVELAARGALAQTPTGVLVQVESCTVPWTEQRARCAAGATLLMPWHRVVPDEDGEPVPVGRLTPTQSHYLLVSLTLPEATPQTSQLLRTQVGLGLTATGDTLLPTPGPPPPTPRPDPTRPDEPRPDEPKPDGPRPDQPRPSGAPWDVTGPGGDATDHPGGTAAGPAPALARTGGDLVPSLLLGVGAVLGGLVLAGAARWLR